MARKPSRGDARKARESSRGRVCGESQAGRPDARVLRSISKAGEPAPDRLRGEEWERAMDQAEIEQWEIQSVIDCDGKTIGKLADVYLAAGSSEPVFAYVKTGMLGRRHVLVPLAGASRSGDHLRVAYQQDHVKNGPQLEPGAALDSALEQAVARHYGIDLTGSAAGDAPRYHSARALEQREAQARAMTERADELTELGAAIKLTGGGLPPSDDDHSEDHTPQDPPTKPPPIP
jgi:PRC-barrel domain protein